GRAMIAFPYPGQGAQKVGMGSDLLDARPDLFDRYFDQVDEASGLTVRQFALEGPQESLTRTDVAQPALFALSLAVTDAARELGITPSFVAGHSLGEYTATVSAGALPLDDGVRLVSLRGRLMNEAQTERPGTMAAVIGLPAERVAELCEQASAAGLVDCVQSLVAAGAASFLEIGPGRVVTGLVRQIVGMDADAASADAPSKLESFVSSRPDVAAT